MSRTDSLKKHTIIGIYPANPVKIARVTGNSLTGETTPNPNQTAKNYDVGGTDLGIMWAMGHGKIGLFFGDTFGRDWTVDDNGKDWRSNVLAFADKKDVSKGLKFSGMAMSRDGKKARQKSTVRTKQAARGIIPPYLPAP